MKRSKGLMIFILFTIVLTAGFIGSGYDRNSVIAAPPDRLGTLAEYDEFMVLYGDPHIHTVLSDGDESPDFAYRYARDVARLDWCSLSDHAEYLDVSAHDYYRSLPEKYDEPGKFCVLFGFEWTSNYYGHRNAYSLDNSIPILPSNVPEYSEPEEMWAGLAGYDVLTVPHHPMIWSTELWHDHLNPALDFNVEFYSKWGLSLYQGNDRPLHTSRAMNGVFVALSQKGLRYGLIAGTDTHMTRPGSNLGESRQEGALPYAQPGLTGVWAASHTREAIFDALKNRRCYGMTGTRVMLQFSVNDHIMGSEITSSDPPVIEFSTSSEKLITEVTIIRIDENEVIPIQTYNPNALEFDGSYTDDGFVQDDAYSVIVLLENTDMAMSTPVWVDKI